VRKLPLAGAGLVVVIDVFYLALIRSQASERVVSLRVPFVAGFIGVMALAAVLGSWRRLDRYARLLLGLSAGGLVAMGLIAIFSVGILILLAAVPIVIAAVQSLVRVRRPIGIVQAFGGLVLALAVFLAGIQLTEIPVACPLRGYEAGSGSGLVSGPYHWTCVNGKLTVAPGECTHGGATVDPSGTVIATSGC
jgi:hypothetical protein